MKIDVVNEDGSTTVWIVHVYRTPAENHQDRHRGTIVKVHEGMCNVIDDRCITPCLSAQTVCNPKDNFSRSAGRKIAFTRAIKDLPQPERKKLWVAYLAVVKVA